MVSFMYLNVGKQSQRYFYGFGEINPFLLAFLYLNFETTIKERACFIFYVRYQGAYQTFLSSQKGWHLCFQVEICHYNVKLNLWKSRGNKKKFHQIPMTLTFDLDLIFKVKGHRSHSTWSHYFTTNHSQVISIYVKILKYKGP